MQEIYSMIVIMSALFLAVWHHMLHHRLVIYPYEIVLGFTRHLTIILALQVSSSSLRKDIGFKTEVSYCDALMVLKSWMTSQAPFSAR